MTLLRSFAMSILALGAAVLCLGPTSLFGGEDLGFEDSISRVAEYPKGDVVIALRDEMEFRSEPLLLSQIGDCSGDEVYCHDAKGIDLGQRATPGKTMILPAALVKKILLAEWPRANVKIVGKTFVKLHCPSIVISNEEVSDLVGKNLERLLQKQTTLRATVERLQMTAPLVVMDEDHEISIIQFQDFAEKPVSELLRALVSNPTLSGVYQSNRGSVRFFAHLTLRVEEKMSVAKRFLPMGSAIDSSMFSTQWYVWSGFKSQSQPVSDASSFVGMILKRAIPAGEPLTLESVARPIAVQRGQGLQVVARNESMDVTIRATAQAAGMAGQSIEVELTSTKKRVMARIVDSTTAELIR